MIKNYIGIIILTIIVFSALIYGFNSSGSPAKVRAKTFDVQRLQDLESIHYQINRYYSQNRVLPSSISQAYDEDSLRFMPKDPETKNDYMYKPVQGQTYELCAVFSTSNRGESEERSNSLPVYYGRGPKHDKGLSCIEYEAPQPINRFEGRPIISPQMPITVPITITPLPAQIGQ